MNVSNSSDINSSHYDNTTCFFVLYNETTALNVTEDYNYYYTSSILLIKVLFPVLVALGTIANMLVIVVLRRGVINTGSLSIFLSVLAVVDTVFLYTSGLKTWIRVMWGFELLHIGSWSCKLGLFLNQLSSTLSAWLVLIIAWQRWYTCSRPFDRCCPVDNSKCGYAAIACLLLILVGANSYVLVTVELYEEPLGYICAPSEPYDIFISDVFPVVLIVLYSGLPAVLLLILNSLLARILYTSRRSLLTHADSARCNSRHDSHVRARYNQVTALLLALSVSWLLLTVPHTLLKMIEHIPDTHYDSAIQRFLNVLFFVFMYINHSINFFLYCALIRGFRREVKNLFLIMTGCAESLSHCCHHHFLRGRGQHLAVSNSSINNIHNRNSNTDSFVPLIELNSAVHPLVVNQNGCRHNPRLDCI